MKGISIKSQEEIELMREAGRILAITHEEMRKALKPGMTTYDIDKLGEEVIRSYHCEPSFLNYQGYPASVCVSVMMRWYMEFHQRTECFRMEI